MIHYRIAAFNLEQSTVNKKEAEKLLDKARKEYDLAIQKWDKRHDSLDVNIAFICHKRASIHSDQLEAANPRRMELYEMATSFKDPNFVKNRLAQYIGYQNELAKIYFQKKMYDKCA